MKMKFAILNPPAFVSVDRDGQELKDEQFYGYLEPEGFYDTLDLIVEYQ